MQKTADGDVLRMFACMRFYRALVSCRERQLHHVFAEHCCAASCLNILCGGAAPNTLPEAPANVSQATTPALLYQQRRFLVISSTVL